MDGLRTMPRSSAVSLDVSCGEVASRGFEQAATMVELNQGSDLVLNPKQGGVVGDAPCLSQIVRDNDDGVAPT